MQVTSFLVRVALAATYISAYSSRINLFGGHPTGWNDFMKYAASVNSFAPAWMQSVLAITATVLEIALSVLLVIGYKTRYTALTSGIVTGSFALAMTISFGIKEPLDYGVFVNFMAAFLVASLPSHRWSLDAYLAK